MLKEQTDVNLPGIMKWLMKMMMCKFSKLAKKHNGILIGQVTGANGKMLQNAIELISGNFVSRNYTTITLAEISNQKVTLG